MGDNVANLFIDLPTFLRLNLVDAREVLEELVFSNLRNSDTEIGGQVNGVAEPGVQEARISLFLPPDGRPMTLLSPVRVIRILCGQRGEIENHAIELLQ